MSGHSKWSQIKRKKGIKDVERGRIFSKLSRAITLSVKLGGGLADPDKNVRLRLAVDRARSFNMPKENVERAIAKAAGGGQDTIKEVVYESFFAHGVTFVIVAATDNPNRTHSEVKNILEKHGAKMGGVGSVLYQFDKCGVVIFDKENVTEEAVIEFAAAISAIDIETDDSHYSVFIPFEMTGKVRDFLGVLEPKSIELDYRPHLQVKIDDIAQARAIFRLVEALESHDDVDKVFANFDITMEIINQIME